MKGSVCLAGFLICFFSAIDVCIAGERPNILFFLVDDMGATDTSVPFLYDRSNQPIAAPLNARYRTLNMERLASQGRKFVNAHAYSVCSPTRAALLTGQDANRLHITTWTHPTKSQPTDESSNPSIKSPEWRVQGLDPATPTLPGILRKAGYRTILCGKAHFGPDDTPAHDPKNLGFDVNIAGFGGGGPGSYWGTKNFSAVWRAPGQTQWNVPGLEKYHGKDIFLTEALTREMSTAIEQSVASKKPFFAYMAHYAVHAPFEVDARYAKNYPALKGNELAFATLVEGMDQSLGDLLAKLEELGVAEDTLVVFYSDNGSDGPANKPLRGGKGTRYEGGLRVPLIAAWAKQNPQNALQKTWPIPAGTIDREMVRPVDFLPTFARLADVAPRADSNFDGIDFSPALIGKPITKPRPFLCNFPHSRGADSLYVCYIEGEWKLSYGYAKQDWQLTNIVDDVGEQKNLVREKPELAKRLADRMLEMLDQQQAQYPVDRKTSNVLKPKMIAE